MPLITPRAEPTKPAISTTTEPEKSELSQGWVWKLVFCVFLFLLVLLTLGFVVKEMLRHLRTETQAKTKPEPAPAPEIWKQRPRGEEPAASETRVEQTDKVLTELKNRAG